jgi:penicillin-binding protein 2
MRKQYLKNHYLEKFMLTRRCLAAFLFILFFILLLIARLVYLQVIEHSYYTTLSKNNRIEIVPLPPTRGLIYDRNGVLLAKNIPVYNLEISPRQIEDLEKTLRTISNLLPISDNEKEVFYKTLHQKRRFETVPLKLRLTEQEVAIFSVNKYRLPGVEIKAGLIRDYPEGKSLAHVLGYVGRINAKEVETLDKANYSATHYTGKTGIEKYYETKLHGKVGYQRIEVDATGNLVRELNINPPVSGETLTLTLDSTLQKIATEALKGHEGAIVAIDPTNGDVLALVSNPGFDPNQFVKGLSTKQYQSLKADQGRPLYNRALRGLYPPGSTVKPFIALGGLDSELINPEQTIFDPGYFKLKFSKHLFHDWKRGGHGKVNLHRAIVESCDTYFYWLAFNMHIAKLDQIFTAFGFGKITGLDLPQELAGLVPSPEWKQAHKQQSWYPGDTLNTGIGQGFMLATPLQLASATATLAARGDEYKPHLLFEAKNETETVTQPPILEKRIMLNNPEGWNVIVKAMEGVIKEASGTGFRFGKNTPYTVAAKTGTAQVFSSHQDKPEKILPKKLRDDGLFIAFAPTDQARIAIAVVVEHNGTVAPNAARKIIDYYLSHLEQEKKHGPT